MEELKVKNEKEILEELKRLFRNQRELEEKEKTVGLSEPESKALKIIPWKINGILWVSGDKKDSLIELMLKNY